MLNTFCYTGGFTVYALQNKATFVHSVDASEKAVELTRKNIELNGFSVLPVHVGRDFENAEDAFENAHDDGERIGDKKKR